MKRLLLGPVVLAPLAFLAYCHMDTHHKAPEVPAIVRQIPLDDAFNAFPTTKPAPRKPHHHHHNRVKPRVLHPVPAARPLAPEAPLETLPPRPACLFPFNLIPYCKAGVP